MHQVLVLGMAMAQACAVVMMSHRYEELWSLKVRCCCFYSSALDLNTCCSLYGCVRRPKVPAKMMHWWT
jgi:hypothetical protein